MYAVLHSQIRAPHTQGLSGLPVYLPHCCATSSLQVGSFFNTVTVSVMLFLSNVGESGRLADESALWKPVGSPQLLTRVAVWQNFETDSVATGTYIVPSY